MRHNCIVLPRDGALHQDMIDDLTMRGYALKMDATLYRRLFGRYDVITPKVGRAHIGNASIQLFPMAAPWR